MRFLFAFFCVLVAGRSLATPEFHPQSTPEYVYIIQLATYLDPQYEDFKKVHALGYIFITQPEDSKMWRVQMGTYSNKNTAQKKLALVKQRGYKDAYLRKIRIDEKDAVYMVQLASYRSNDKIYWPEYQRLTPHLCVQLSDSRVRIAAGPYRTRAEADRAAADLKKRGESDVLIKRTSEKVIHAAHPFEMGDAPTADLGVERRTVRDMQRFLQQAGLYTESVDGLLGPQTNAGRTAFKKTKSRYGRYETLSTNYALHGESKTAPFSLQYYIDLIPNNPQKAVDGLQEHLDHPMAKVYLAYTYLTETVGQPPVGQEINTLMNGALGQVFRDFKGDTRYDFSLKYAYEDAEQLLQHAREIQGVVRDAPAVPCWLFKRHPQIMAEAYAPYWKNTRDQFQLSADCGSFFDVRALKVLAIIAEDLHAGNQKGTQRDVATLSRMYAIPQVLDPAEAQRVDAWNDKLWKSMQTWGAQSAMQAELYETFQFAFYDALLDIENRYLEQGFLPSDARTMGLATIQAMIGSDLRGFVG